MTTPYWSDETCSLFLGDCLEVLAGMDAASVDAIVTDPPYGLEFMGKDWDRPWAVTPRARVGFKGREDNLTLPSHRDGRNANCRTCGGRARGGRRCTCAGPDWDRPPSDDMREYQAWCETWARECLRVLKPGGWLLAFGGTRTAHRLTCGIEDAGFEIRDSVADLTGYDAANLLWLYGSGFPKSLDVSKAIDKLKRRDYVLAAIDLGLEVPGNNLHDWTKAEHSPGDEWWERFKAHLSADDWQRIERAVVGRAHRKNDRDATSIQLGRKADDYDLTAPATPDAACWEGWGTALKPAHEPIVVARKPLAGTVAQNVLEHGTGALNIDGCRVGDGRRVNSAGSPSSLQRVSRVEHGYRESLTACEGQPSEVSGRWPPNVVLGPEAAAELDRQSGVTASRAGSPRRSASPGDGYGMVHTGAEYEDSGGASRFFPVFRYEAKAASTERPRGEDGTAHPTVKPVDLMAWLVRLVTPPDGLVLDPFAGSGTTAEACIVEGFRCVLIEKDPAYAELIRARLRKPIQPAMFGGVA